MQKISASTSELYLLVKRSSENLLGTFDEDAAKKMDDEDSTASEETTFSLLQAVALNTLMMFGTGPFITIPLCISSTNPPGPYALIGYAIAGLACLCDSFIWAELGALYPKSGGSYVYLEKCLGKKVGRLMSFLFLWQLLITGPMEIASGFIAIAQYMAYITEVEVNFHNSLIAFGFAVTCILLLYRDMREVGSTTVVLWIGMCGAIVFTVVAGFSNTHGEYLKLPEVKPGKMMGLIWSLGSAARFGIYDFTGYYDVNFIGREVENPRRAIPIAGIVTCAVVCVVYFLTYLSVMVYLPWDGPDGYVAKALNDDGGANYIMSVFCEKMFNREFAIFFTLVVVYCIYGSCFSLMLGFAQIPAAAAKNGMFFKFFAHRHDKGFHDHSLLFMGFFTCVFCFVDLGMVIEGMMVTTLATMFLANAVALVYHRWTRPDMARPYCMPLYPLPVVIQFVMFGFVFLTSPNYVIEGKEPLLELGLAFLLMGCGAFLIFAKSVGEWPFEPKSKEEGEFEPVSTQDKPKKSTALTAKEGGAKAKPETEEESEVTSESEAPEEARKDLL